MSELIFLFMYFLGGGQSGAHLAWSEDGRQWQTLNNGEAVIAPESGLMRDPYLYWSEEEDRYHLIWTTAWNSKTIGHATSPDLVNWSEQERLPVMQGIQGVRNCWAPELYYDHEREHYLLFWASTVKGKFEETAGSSEDDYNHRMWYTTTRNFRSFTPPEIFFDPGFNVIDSTMIKMDEAYYLITKDERLEPERKLLFVSSAPTPTGPWSEPGPPISDSWVEGPATLRCDESIIVIFDRYRKQQYGAIRTRDFVNWEDISDQVSLPEGARHGSVVRVPRSHLEPLLD